MSPPQGHATAPSARTGAGSSIGGSIAGGVVTGSLQPQLPPDPPGSLHDGPQLVLGLVHGPGLEPAVRVDERPLRRDDLQRPPDPRLHLVRRLDPVGMRVRHAEPDRLRERELPEVVQEVEVRVRHLEVDLVHRKVEHLRVRVVEVAVADVGDRVDPVESRGDHAEGLDRELQLVHPRGHGRLVDLDERGPGGLEILGLLPDRLGQGHHQVLPGPVRLVERPVADRVRAGEHAFHRAVGERLGELPPLQRDRVGPAELPGDDGLAVEPVPVGPDQPALGEPLELLGEERHHVAPVLLAVHDDVDPDLVLEPDPVLGDLALEGLEVLPRDPPPGEVRPRRQDLRRLRQRPHLGGPQPLHLRHDTASFTSASRRSFRSAASLGRNSSPHDGASHRRSSGTFSATSPTARASCSTDSSFVLRASAIPAWMIRSPGSLESSSPLCHPDTRSRPNPSNGRSNSAVPKGATSPKYVARIVVASTASASVPATAAKASRSPGGCPGTRARAGSSNWITVAPAAARSRASSRSALARSRSSDARSPPLSSLDSDASVYGPHSTAFTGRSLFEAANENSSTRMGRSRRTGPFTTGWRKYVLLSKNRMRPESANPSRPSATRVTGSSHRTWPSVTRSTPAAACSARISAVRSSSAARTSSAVASPRSTAWRALRRRNSPPSLGGRG